MIFLHFVLLLLSATAVIAMWPETTILGETCNTASTLAFDNCTSSDAFCLCKNNNFLATVAFCVANFAQDSEIRDRAWNHFITANCKQHDKSMIDKSYYDAINHLQHSTVLAGPDTPPDTHSWGAGPVYTNPLAISEVLYKHSAISVRNYLHSKDVSQWQGEILVAYWGFVILLFGFIRFLRYMSVRFNGQYSTMRRPNALMRFIQRNITLPALFGYKHMTKVKLLGFINVTLPTRMETIFIFFYLALNVVFDVVSYTFISNDTLFPTHYKEMLRYASDRSGIIGVIQLPLLTLFASRNNILIWVTGWSYSTFNTYHRAITRITYAQFIVHSVTKHIFSLSYGGSMVKYFYPLPYYRWGVAAMFLMAIMIASAIFRMKHYELFLRLHILCGIASYICILYHMRGLGYKQTVYVAFGVWGADWLLRVTRIIFFNFAIFVSPVSRKKSSFAELCALTGDIANVRVRATVLWKPKPGEYVFIYINRRIWEAHPFSVVGPSSDGESFQLLCKARGGMTKRFNQALRDEGCDKDHPLVKPVLIEGPYGLHCPVERYSEVLLVAGGVGITGVIPYVEFLTHHPSTHPNRLLFVWAVQSRSDTRWIEERLLRLSNKVEIVIYSASPNQTQSSTQEFKSYAYESGSSPTDIDSPDHYYGEDDITDRRDNLFQLVDEEEDNLSISSSRYDDEKAEEQTRGRHQARSTQSSPYDKTQFGRSLTLKPALSSQRAHPEKSSKSTTADTGTAYPQSQTPTPPPKSSSQMYPTMASLTNETTRSNTTVQHKTHRKRLSKTEWFQQIRDGRADIPATVKEFLMGSSGSACVLGCGPPRMMDSMRQSVARYLDLNENGRVDYFEEAYSW